jgi:hypothetical protein
VLLVVAPAASAAPQLNLQLLASDGAAGDAFGSSADIDGDVVVVGAPGDNSGRGAAYVYTRANNTWPQTAKLTASDGAAGDRFGNSVAVDGDTIVVGAPLVGADVGAAYTFTLAGAQTAKLTVSGVPEDQRLGSAVAIDGDTVVVGAEQHAAPLSSEGAVYTYTRTGGDRTPTALLTVPGATPEARLGSAVAIDGNTIVAGAFNEGDVPQFFPLDGQGAAYTFARTGGDRGPTAKLTASNARREDEFGRSVAIDGDAIVVGAPFATPSGSAYRFARTGADRTEAVKYVSPTGGAQGQSVSLSSAMVVAGAPSPGRVFRFARHGTSPAPLGSFASPDLVGGDSFGTAVALDVRNLAVGAPLDDVAANADQGSVWLWFERPARPGVVQTSTTWKLRNTITGGPPTTTLSYGAKPNVPVVGDWDGNGSRTLASYEAGVLKLRNSWSVGLPNVTITFGDPKGFPVSGDFDGNGTDDLAVYRNGTWQVRLSTGATSTFSFGSGNWPATIPVAGDWDGDGTDGIGTYTYATSNWNLRQTATAGIADAASFTSGVPNLTYPVVGDWDGNGSDNIGIRTGDSWLLRNQSFTGTAAYTFQYGGANDLPFTWNN